MHAISEALPKTATKTATKPLYRCGRLVRTLSGCQGMAFVKESDGGKDYAFFVDPANGDYVAGVWQCSVCRFYFPDEHVDPKLHGQRPTIYMSESKETKLCRTCLPKWHKEVYEPLINGQKVHLQVPLEYLAASPSDLDRQVRQTVLAWPLPLRFVILVGVCGVGKTHALWVAAKSASEKGQSVTVKHIPAMRSTWIASEDRDQVERGWINAPALMLDDLTSGAASEGWTEAIRLVLNERIARQMPTFITASATTVDIGKGFGAAFESRLNMFRVHILTGPDRRKAKS